MRIVQTRRFKARGTPVAVAGLEAAKYEDEEKLEAFMMSGLSKTIFFKMLMQHGVHLSEFEKALLTTVFGLRKENSDKLDYEKLDAAFEGVQQELYAQEVQYTTLWERRLFKRIGNYLMKYNKSISECFDLIDTDQSQTISFEELKNALSRFQLSISDRQLQIFLDRLGASQKTYITKHEFLTRFWAAYTYEDVAEESSKAEDAKNAEQDWFESVSLPKHLSMVSQNL